jgi:hypothetical protein
MDDGIVLDTSWALTVEELCELEAEELCELVAEELTSTPVTWTVYEAVGPNHWWPSQTIRYWGE